MPSRAPRLRNLPVTTSGTVLIHADFLLAGIVMTFLGPMLPILAARWGISDAVAGRLFLTQFISSMFGMMLSSVLVQRKGYRATLILGLVLMAAGMTLLASGPFLLGIAAVATLGVGHGLTTPAGNLRTAEINPHRSASALNVINAVWGIGALSPSFFIGIARHAGRPEWFLYGAAALLLPLLLFFALSRFEPDTPRATENAQPGTKSVLSHQLLVPVALLLFFYVGTEVAFGQWIATFAHRVNPSAPNSWTQNSWTMMASLFYGSLLAGRIVAPLALRRVRATTLAECGLSLAVLGGLAFLKAHGMGLVAAGALLTGLGLSSVFPISVSLFVTWFGDSARRASGPVFAMGNMGGAVLPWLVGVVSTHSGSLRLAFCVPLIGAVFMLGFYLFGQSKTKSFATEATEFRRGTQQK